MKTLLILVTVYYAAAIAKTMYNQGYIVYDTRPEGQKQHNALVLMNNVGKVLLNRPFQVIFRVIYKDNETFIDLLQKCHVKYEVIKVERPHPMKRKYRLLSMQNREGISFNTYHRYQVIQNYLLKLAENYPDSISVENIGTSYENRTIHMIKIGRWNSSNPTILIDGGIHAREWISPAFVTYLIHELVENKNNRYMIESTNWFIIPVLNPDGYEYTHTNDRLWRKTRSIGKNCIGVDANRNFDYHWMEEGGSSNECRGSYSGPSPFSEPETAALRDVVNRYKKQIKLYLSFHSYGNYILYPWGYTTDPPVDVEEIRGLAVNVNNSIASVSGTGYTIGGSMDILYAASGESIDWVKAVGGVELSYSIELTGGGNSGFDLPPSEILNVCHETFEGIKVFQRYIEQKFATV